MSIIWHMYGVMYNSHFKIDNFVHSDLHALSNGPRGNNNQALNPPYSYMARPKHWFKHWVPQRAHIDLIQYKQGRMHLDARMCGWMYGTKRWVVCKKGYTRYRFECRCHNGISLRVYQRCIFLRFRCNRDIIATKRRKSFVLF